MQYPEHFLGELKYEVQLLPYLVINKAIYFLTQ